MLPIVLTPEGPVPLYLQIKYQISYLITSGQLGVGEKLPPVRSVSERLGVNPGTVAQAYRELRHEGLIEAAVGRGTFVAPTIPISPDTAVRQMEGTRALDQALDRLRSLALTDAEIRLRFEAVLASKPVARHVILAAPTAKTGLKYAATLDRELGPAVTVHTVTYADLERRSPHVAMLLELCYFVVTFASSVRRIELALEPFGRPCRVLGMTTELQPQTIAALKLIPRGARAVVLSEERYAHQSLGLVVQHSGLKASEVEMQLVEELRATSLDLTSADLVIHTFATRDEAERLGSRQTRRMELVFDAVKESITHLRRILSPEEVDGPSGRA